LKLAYAVNLLEYLILILDSFLKRIGNASKVATSKYEINELPSITVAEKKRNNENIH